MADLLPCPFCGSTNLRYEFAGSQGYIECNECGTEGPCDERAADPYCDDDAACDAWNRRAAALADGPAVPQPQPPAEGEVGELVQLLRHAAEVDGWDGASPEWCQSMLRAADLLQRLSPPQPVPVSERPPEDQLCWWFEPDEEDDEAYGSSWTLLRICGGTSSYTHCLPAHALPIPHQQENAND